MKITRQMRLLVRGHVLRYLVRAFPQVGPCNWHQMVASSSSITTTRKRPGSIHVPVEQVPCQIPQVPRPSNESPRMNWDHCPKDGKKEFIRMDEYSSLIIVSREKMRKWKHESKIFFSSLTDTRTTQWDDPRLSNPNIAGQAVPYSRDYKQKYEYLKSQLRKPVSFF